MRSAAVDVVVLAAGEGTRMRSTRPKPLHRLCGRPMVRYVVGAAEGADARQIVVVVGRGASRLGDGLGDVKPVTDVVEQAIRRGTGDAVLTGVAALDDDYDPEASDVLILPCDVPLVQPELVAEILAAHRDAENAATVVTVDRGSVPNPDRRMRVVRGGRLDALQQVVEAHDLVGDERQLAEVATDIWCVRRHLLAAALRRISPDPTTDEISLAGIAEVLVEAGHRVGVFPASVDAAGINDRVELATAEARLRDRINIAWLERGVTMLDPQHTYIDATVELAADVTLFPGTILQGDTVVATGAEIGPDSRLVDTRVGPGSRIEKTMAEMSTIGAGCQVGPFAVLRSGAELASAVVTGPFYDSDNPG